VTPPTRAERRRAAKVESAAPASRTPPRRLPVVPLPSVPWQAHLPALLSLPLLAFGLYWPSLNGPFVFDDPNAVSQSNLIRSLDPRLYLHLSTRPLTDYTLAINYAIDGLEPWTFHLTNLLLHIGNAVLLYAIAWQTLALPALAERYGAARRWIAWAAAALFLAHPLATETVAYISSRSEVLVATFYLLSVLSFIIAATTARAQTRRVHTIALFCWGLAGLACKETALTIAPALLLYDWLLLSGGGWRRSRWPLLGVAALPLALGGTVLLLRAIFNPSPMGEYSATAGLGFDRFTPWQYLMTQFGVIAHYLRLVVLPVGQTFDYDWPLARSLFAPDVFIPLALLIALVALAWRLRHREALFTFAVGWTLLVLAPTSSVVPIADLAVERRMYVPLAAITLLAAAWLWDLVRLLPAAWRSRSPWAYATAVTLLLALLAVPTFTRASLWGDAIALHEDGVAKAPGNPRVRLNLGVTYLNMHQQQQAYATLLEAKRLYDRQESIHAFPRIGAFIQYNLGAVMFARAEFDRAETELERALELGGQYLALRPMAKMLLSRVAAQRGDWKKATEELKEALKYQDNPDWRVDLAEMQRRGGQIPAARATLQQTLRTYPGNQRATALLAQINKPAPPPAPAPAAPVEP
jgi:tetratricopeptide (TPR) repeat protein